MWDDNLTDSLVVGTQLGFLIERSQPLPTRLDSTYWWEVADKSLPPYIATPADPYPPYYWFTKHYSGLQFMSGFHVDSYGYDKRSYINEIQYGAGRDFSVEFFQQNPSRPDWQSYAERTFGNCRLKMFYGNSANEPPSPNTISSPFQLRGLAITNLKSTPERVEVDGVIQKVTITGDITVYPNMDTNGVAGWTPTEPIDWKVVIKNKAVDPSKWVIADTTAPGSTYLPVTPVAPNNAGVVGSFSIEWDGTFDSLNAPPYDTDDIAFLPMDIEARAMVQTSASPLRNTLSPITKTGVHCKKCENSLIDLYLTMMFLIALFGEDGPKVPLGHNSGEAENGVASMGYGWFSTENIKVIDISDTLDGSDLAYCDETGMTRRWIKVGSEYVPALPDNKMKISYNPSGGNATYVVTWPNNFRREFNRDVEGVGHLRKEVNRNGRSTTYTKDTLNSYLKLADDKGRDVYMHFNSGESQPRVINDNANPALGRGQVLDYYMSGSTQKQLKSISVPMNLAAPVSDKTVFVYGASDRIIEQREETTNHHRSVHYVYDPTGAGRLASKKVTSTLLHPSDPLLNVVTEHSLETYEYQVSFTYGGVDYVTTKIVTEDLQDSGDPEQEKAPTRIFYRAYDSLSRILGEFEYVEDDENDDPIYIATLHEYDPNVSGNPDDPWLRTRTLQVNKETETLFEYTARGNVKKITNKKVTDLSGDETVFSCVEENPSHPAYATFPDLVTEIRRPAPDRDVAPSTFYPTTKFSYDPANGNLLSVEDAKFKISHFRYNGDGQVNRIINRRGFKTYMEYDGKARLSKIHSQKSLNPTPLITEYVNENPADFRTVEMSYDAYDNLILTEDANGNTVEMAYDARNRPTLITDGNDVDRVFSYLNGVLDQVTLPDSSGTSGLHTGRVAKTEYDSAGRSLAILRQDSSNAAQMRVGFSYDGFSQLRSLIRTKNGVDKAHRTEYDRQGRTVKSIDAKEKESSAAYAPFCKEYATTSARGVRTRSEFDKMCRLTSVVVGDPDSDPLKPLDIVNVRETRSFEHDDLGRLTKTSQAASTASTYGQATFGTSRYGSGAGSAEEREFEYNELDQVTKLTFEDGKEMLFEYDDEGNLTKVTENASATSKVTEFSYYGDNRLHEVTYKNRSGGDQIFTYAYDLGGRPLTLTYPASTGIVAHFSGPNSEPGWDGNGQLKHLLYVKGVSTLVRRFEYDYDDAGNRITQLDVTPTKATYWAYGYDWLDRLESVKKVETTNSTILALIQNLPAEDALPLMGALQLVAMYTYDAADNRYLFEVPDLSDPLLTETFKYSFDDADNITLIQKKVGSGAFADFETFTPADDDGNMTSRTRGGVTTTYHWDFFNRLAAISTSDNSKKQSHTFGISGFRRKKKDKDDVETTEYAAGLSTEVSKVTSGETITYLKGGGGIMGFERSSDGAMFYFLTDALSTVRDVVDSTGAVRASYEFDEYGQRIATSESGVSSQKTFVGGLSVQDEVADTGLMMMGHRFYAPDLGRFLNRDPIGFAGGMNLFGYAGGRPISSIDPHGLDEEGPADHPNEILYQELKALSKLYGEDMTDQMPAHWPDLQESSLAMFLVGYGDSWSFGLTEWARESGGPGDVIDENSSAYGRGHLSALLGSLGRLAYAGLARGIPRIAGICKSGSLQDTAQFAHNSRNWLKRIFRFPFPPNFGGRLYSWEQMVAKTLKKLDIKSMADPADAARVFEAIIKSAGRTGRLENLYGPVGIAGNAASRASQP